MKRTEQMDILIEGMVRTFAFHPFFNGTPIQLACVDVARARGGRAAEWLAAHEVQAQACCEREEAEHQERLQREADERDARDMEEYERLKQKFGASQ